MFNSNFEAFKRLETTSGIIFRMKTFVKVLNLFTNSTKQLTVICKKKTSFKVENNALTGINKSKTTLKMSKKSLC